MDKVEYTELEESMIDSPRVWKEDTSAVGVQPSDLPELDQQSFKFLYDIVSERLANNTDRSSNIGPLCKFFEQWETVNVLIAGACHTGKSLFWSKVTQQSTESSCGGNSTTQNVHSFAVKQLKWIDTPGIQVTDPPTKEQLKKLDSDVQNWIQEYTPHFFLLMTRANVIFPPVVAQRVLHKMLANHIPCIYVLTDCGRIDTEPESGDPDQLSEFDRKSKERREICSVVLRQLGLSVDAISSAVQTSSVKDFPTTMNKNTVDDLDGPAVFSFVPGLLYGANINSADVKRGGKVVAPVKGIKEIVETILDFGKLPLQVSSSFLSWSKDMNSRKKFISFFKQLLVECSLPSQRRAAALFFFGKRGAMFALRCMGLSINMDTLGSVTLTQGWKSINGYWVEQEGNRLPVSPTAMTRNKSFAEIV